MAKPATLDGYSNQYTAASASTIISTHPFPSPRLLSDGGK